MRALIAVMLCIAVPTFAQQAPTLEPSSVTYTLSEKEMDLLNARLARLDAENKVYKEQVEKTPSTWVYVVVSIVLVGAGAAAGAAIATAVKPAPVK